MSDTTEPTSVRRSILSRRRLLVVAGTAGVTGAGATASANARSSTGRNSVGLAPVALAIVRQAREDRVILMISRRDGFGRTTEGMALEALYHDYWHLPVAPESRVVVSWGSDGAPRAEPVFVQGAGLVRKLTAAEVFVGSDEFAVDTAATFWARDRWGRWGTIDSREEFVGKQIGFHRTEHRGPGGVAYASMVWQA